MALNKEYRDLEDIVAAHKRYDELLSNIAASRHILAEESDDEMRALAKEELEALEPQVGPMEEEIKLLLLPQDP